jgi:hypothetical protein
MKKSVLFLVLIALGATAQSLLAGGGPQHPAPDSGTTVTMLSAGVGGLMWARKYFRR